MIRFMDSFIGMFVQDMGNVFTYLTWEMIPEGTDIMKLQETAFNNLVRDIHYRVSESREAGIYGILAGGDFEAESLCLSDIWKQLAQEFGDDLLICVPVKDIVFFTRAGDRKRRNRMLKMADEMFEQNRKETPYLLFCRDVFLFSQEDGTLQISRNIRY